MGTQIPKLMYFSGTSINDKDLKVTSEEAQKVLNNIKSRVYTTEVLTGQPKSRK